MTIPEEIFEEIKKDLGMDPGILGISVNTIEKSYEIMLNKGMTIEGAKKSILDLWIKSKP